jgi:peptidoglycan/xylan/chitin deacetylase (PgdA/CDA1 family)
VRGLARRVRRWFRARGGPAILMYHRIATPDVDPWGLAVSPERFGEQVQALRGNRTTLSMDSFVAGLESASLPHDAVALTFDDGYADNLLRAKPILEVAGVSATVFLPTGLIGTGEAFWWDELAGMVLRRADPLSTSVMMKADCLQIELPPIDAEVEPRASWRYWDRPVTAREQVYQALWQALWDCPPGCRKTTMERLRQLFGAPSSSPDALPMGADDVRQLVSDHVSAGAHGRFHQPLTSLPAAARFEELQRSRLEVEALSGLPVTGFAYPHGAFNPEIVNMVRQAGYRWACSTIEAATNPKRVNIYSLPRIAVGDWPGDTLLGKLDAISQEL